MTILLAPPPASTTDPLAVILPHLHNLASTDLAATNLAATRRGLLLAPLLAALPLGFLTDPAAAIDPSQTQVMLPDQFKWQSPGWAPPHAFETAPVFGATDQPGPYVVLVKWHPGYMSAPHTYVTDRRALSSPAPGG
jgi:hypothetical protein